MSLNQVIGADYYTALWVRADRREAEAYDRDADWVEVSAGAERRDGSPP